MKVADVIEDIKLIDELDGMFKEAISCQKNDEMLVIPTDYIPDITGLLARYKCMILNKEIK